MSALTAKKTVPAAAGSAGWRAWAPWMLGLVLLLAGIPAFYSRIVLNHHGDVTSYVPWGLWVGSYVYLVWLEVGSILVYTVITYVLDRPDLKKVGRAVLLTALVALICALFLIAMDLGHVWRLYKAFVQPQFSSLMSWMIWLHSAYLVILVWELWLNVKPDLAARAGKPLAPQALEGLKKTGGLLAFISLPAGVILISIIGGLFGVIAGRPYWNASILPMVFFISSLVAGAGLITVIAAL
ncbi:MAG TPA: NrfD/PsrC family molybdoenzyme membrane anchor subunit, partial [Symbiobacteriaceae bacterium]|nr:NrfD/PsrC family molybdoenzyme membrane anchor subunit [Symbiobacteriaceae bacterium]